MRITLAAVLLIAGLSLAQDAKAARASGSLSSELGRAIFLHSDTVHATDEYEYVAMSVSYNEPDNVTCSMCGWATHSPWCVDPFLVCSFSHRNQLAGIISGSEIRLRPQHLRPRRQPSARM